MSHNRLLKRLKRPLALAMWDFSWLERRWPGAGYEDWDQALDELQERGYDAVRIDPYPHLLATDPFAEYELQPAFADGAWGAPGRTRVRVLPGLLEFMGKCAERGIGVGLSSWFRQDVAQHRLRLSTPQRLAEAWAITLGQIAQAGLLDTVLYLDFCNEFPVCVWAPFLYGTSEAPTLPRNHPEVGRWLQQSVEHLRPLHPHLPLTFSFTNLNDGLWPQMEVGCLDFLEPHLWMTEFSHFDARVQHMAHTRDLFEAYALCGEPLFRMDEARWRGALSRAIALGVAWSQQSGLPLVTTEGWGVVMYKDWPLLDWGWVKELCEQGTLEAAASGCWAALATSNFCGPQFQGMWRDVGWHQRLTRAIHEARLPVD